MIDRLFLFTLLSSLKSALDSKCKKVYFLRYHVKHFLTITTPLGNTIRREIPMLVTGGWPLPFYPLITAELTADWKVSAPPIEKMSPRNQITASMRVDTRWGGSLCSHVGKRERKSRMEIVMAPVSQAIKQYWSSLPSGRSNLQRLVRNENDVIPRLVHPAFIISFARTRNVESSFREPVAIDFTEFAKRGRNSKIQEMRSTQFKDFFLKQ